MIGIEPLDATCFAGLLHDWVTRPYAVYWGMQDASVAEVREAYEEIGASPHHDAWLGSIDHRPVFLCETYSPEHSPLAQVYEVLPGDLGMHVLVGPPVGARMPGFTRRVMRAVMDHCFADPTVRRVVVEPDVRNAAVQVLNAEMGFVAEREVELPDKTALLSFCRRSDYVAAVAS
ncbi:N-acetyltransferase [Nocardioides mangrovicus]|uniref:Lysine N-acyltransferase MbtK n=1 Tax=Nocardioides mangrovicus TaxID=2478913 RepID=A0A3L8P5H2_9ACTN|nr:GNAT family N-acetyltransferase [Nocardioides mangrovicus]RLV50292.1 N-acetyltransferase [Nocardioides mangrovicus]